MRSRPANSGRARRLKGLVRKETLQIVRDPSSIAIAFVLPIILLILFGYGVSLDATNVKVGIVVESPTPATQGFVTTLSNSRSFDVTIFRHRAPAEDGLVAGRLMGVVVLGAEFSGRLAGGDVGQIQVLVDGTDPNTARLVQGYVQGAWGKWLEHDARDKGAPIVLPVSAEARVRFNPEVRSRNFLVPGLIAIIMSLIGTLLTALVVSREWERGTMEALMATPISVVELVIGKLIPYFVLGMGSMALSVAMAVWVFAVPLRGSLAVLFGVAAVFMVAALGMGLLISTIARNQMAASQAGIVAAFLPAMMLSGFIFDINSMPAAIQAITYVLAARYFVSTLQTLFMVGDVWSVIVPDVLAMAAIALFFLAVTALKTRKRLD
jgi:ABC-2 type transport system permease protein